MENKKRFVKHPSGLYLPKDHHSVSDWDHNPEAIWSLDDTQFVSVPRSLRLSGEGAPGTISLFLCRVGTTPYLPQGRLITYIRTQYTYQAHLLYFRNQAALGGADRANTYELSILFNAWGVDRRVNNVPTSIGAGATSTPPDTWARFRLTWWNGTTPEGVPALTISLDKYIAGEWVQQGDWLYDTENMWATSDINRCGPGGYEVSYAYLWHDDTEVWGPV